MQRWLDNKILHSIAVIIVSAFLSMLLWMTGVLETWESKTWDLRTRISAQAGKATDSIRLILLDQNSLDWGLEVNGWSWPWPREVFGAIVSFCKRGGAKALALDILFLEPSVYGTDDDLSFGRTIVENGQVIGAVFLGSETGKSKKWADSIPYFHLNITGINQHDTLKDNESITFPRASFPIFEVAENLALIGNVHLDPDQDGVYRRVDLFSIFDDKYISSLGLGTYLYAKSITNIEIKPGYYHIDQKKIPLDSSGKAILNYRGPPGTHKAFSAASVIQSEIQILSGEKPNIDPRSAFKDKYVFFGFSAPGLYDLRPSPTSGVFPGVEIHATLLDNILSDDFIREIPLWLTYLLVMLLASICSSLIYLFRNPIVIFVFSAVIVSVVFMISLWSMSFCYWFPLVPSEFTCITALLFSLAVNYATEGRQKRFIKNAFRQYLSPDFIEQLIAHPERLKLGGERRQLSIFFSDLQGFTTISEGLEPEELTHLLNVYLTAMTDIITEEGGTVDKYEGDAIIAFWNAPIDVPDHAIRCVSAAIRCQSKLAEMRQNLYEQVGHHILMRIGINTGHAVVGNFGSHTKFDYTMLGDSVNLAARLEGVNKQFGTYTMISENTRKAIGDSFAVRELARVTVVGKKEPVTIFEPLLWDVFNTNKNNYLTFDHGLHLFYAGQFGEAHSTFIAIADQDPVAEAYVKKCEIMSIAPTPDNWQGVWVMSSK